MTTIKPNTVPPSSMNNKVQARYAPSMVSVRYIHRSPKATVANTQRLTSAKPTAPVAIDLAREGIVTCSTSKQKSRGKPPFLTCSIQVRSEIEQVRKGGLPPQFIERFAAGILAEQVEF